MESKPEFGQISHGKGDRTFAAWLSSMMSACFPSSLFSDSLPFAPSFSIVDLISLHMKRSGGVIRPLSYCSRFGSKS